MTTQIELIHVLRKLTSADRFESEVPVRIPIAGEIECLSPAQMDAKGLNEGSEKAVMGVYQHSTALYFVRHSQVAALELPPVSEIKKFRFRVLTSVEIGGQEKEVAVSCAITKQHYEDGADPDDALPGYNWLFLVTYEDGIFQLKHGREGCGGPGGGDLCDELRCQDTTDVCKKIHCLLDGCQI